jgi:hypothetical protein
LGIQIAVIFLVPALLALLAYKVFGISFMYVFPLAFIISWTGVILLYKKISKEVRALDARIKELRVQETKPDESLGDSSDTK